MKAHQCRSRYAQSRARGVSLIEALLALVVMSLGMLAVVGVQATLRSNGDLSRQRAEAVRLAQEALENWRTFVSLNTVAGQVDYTDLVSDAGLVNVSPAGANTVYSMRRTVAPDPLSGSPPFRTLSVMVEWRDRTDTRQEVNLFTAVARVAPAVSASLSVPSNGGPARRPQGRHIAIPRDAIAQTDGTSTFTPPQPQGADPVTLVFDNITGLISKICTVTNEVVVCTTDQAQLVSGFVRAAIPPVYPNPLAISDAAALDPQSTVSQLADFLNGRSLELTVKYTSSADPTTTRTAACFSDPLATTNTSTAIEYFCVVRLYATTQAAASWTGSLEFGPTPGVVTDSAAANLVSDKLLRACRYKQTAQSYSSISAPQGNQNFLLIAAGNGTTANTCPASASVAFQPPP